MKMKKNKVEIAIALILITFTILMPISFAANMPKIDLTKGTIEQNPAINTLAKIPKYIINFFDIIPLVSADSGCCTNSSSGGLCTIVQNITSCDHGDFYEGQDCNQICAGCCMNLNTGECMPNSNNLNCKAPVFPNSFFQLGDLSCQTIPTCKLGCCTIVFGKKYTTNNTCDIMGGTWDSSVPDEATCSAQSYNDQYGCCKYGCKYERAEDCANKLGWTVENVVREGIFSLKKCYQIPECNNADKCGSSPDKTGCLNNSLELYEADNCGNIYPDEIADSCSTKTPSSYCGLNPTGGYSCLDGTCTNVIDNGELVNGQYSTFQLPEQHGNNMNNGESWCVYDTASDLGNGTIPMGSYSRRAVCIRGNVTIEPCDYYRQTFCFQSAGACVPIQNGASEDVIATCISKDEQTCTYPCNWRSAINYARCMPNMYQSCVNITKQYDCENNAFCYWWTSLPVKKDNNVIDLSQTNWLGFTRMADGDIQRQLCLPKIKPGLNDINKELFCPQGTYVCPFSSAYFGLDHENDECTKTEWYSSMAQRCKALGDCGIWKNYIGDTITGLKIGEAQDKPANTNDIRTKTEIPTPTDYMEVVNGLHITQPGTPSATTSGQVGGLFAIMAAVALIAAKLGVFSSIAWWGWVGTNVGIGGTGFFGGMWTGVGGTVNVWPGIISSAAISIVAITAGILILIYANSLPVGAGRGALESLGWGLISGGGALIFGASLATAGIIAGSVFVVLFGLFWITYDKKFYYVQCLPSLAPSGGDKCHVCNEDPNRPCNKYSCESLGQACEWNNTITLSDNQGHQKTVTLSDADVQCLASTNTGVPPKIESITAANSTGYSFGVSPAGGSYHDPPQTIDITKDNGPVPEGTPIAVTITLDKNSLCWMDYVQTTSIVNMQSPFGTSSPSKNKTAILYPYNKLNYTYIRCTDPYGNANDGEYTLRFFTETVDHTAPLIWGTDKDRDNKFIQGITELNLTIEVNEQATCRWTKGADVPYDAMSSITECNATTPTQSGYICKTLLTGLQSDVSNQFFIRCRDRTAQLNEMQQGYELMLYPVPAITIDIVQPQNNSQIEQGCSFSGITIEVSTSNGANNGKAICSLLNGANPIRFNVTGNTTHMTNITITNPQGSNIPQNINIGCTDIDQVSSSTTNLQFNVLADVRPVTITRMYKDNSNLVIKTNKEAICTYHYSAGHKINNCDFDPKDASQLTAKKFDSTGNIVHSTSWDTEPWYVKCYDACNNVSECTTIQPQDIG